MTLYDAPSSPPRVVPNRHQPGTPQPAVREETMTLLDVPSSPPRLAKGRQPPKASPKAWEVRPLQTPTLPHESSLFLPGKLGRQTGQIPDRLGLYHQPPEPSVL